MCSFNKSYICGLVFVFLDLLQGISTLAFYSYQEDQHSHCSYAHGIEACDYFFWGANHSVRVKIGIGEGLVCIAVSCMLALCFKMQMTLMIWLWIFKPVTVLILNLYFVGGWLVERGRYYHSNLLPEQIAQESLFIYFGGATAASQVLMAFPFCCIGAMFFYQIRRHRRRPSGGSSSCETKV